MNIYLVALTDPDNAVWKRIRDTWPDSHNIASETVAFVRCNDFVTPSSVRRHLGIDLGENEASGIVVSIHPKDYSGVVPIETVDWLREAEDQRRIA